MKLIVGLGNPGDSYLNTRHNVGYIFVDEYQRLQSPKNVLVRKTNVFMNDSGSFVKAQSDRYQIKPEDIFIVHDDLDIPLGEFKIQFGRGPKDHNGLKSIDDKLGSSAYWHVRIGVDSRDPDNRPLGEEYVLQNFKNDERQILDKVIKEACKKLSTFLMTQ
jgi:PTH1 family peptidyl-tRNA hydrolase